MVKFRVDVTIQRADPLWEILDPLLNSKFYKTLVLVYVVTPCSCIYKSVPLRHSIHSYPGEHRVNLLLYFTVPAECTNDKAIVVIVIALHLKIFAPRK